MDTDEMRHETVCELMKENLKGADTGVETEQYRYCDTGNEEGYLFCILPLLLMFAMSSNVSFLNITHIH